MLEGLGCSEGWSIVCHLQCEELFHRQRPAEIEPLEGVASKQFVEVYLFSCLDTFNDQRKVQQGGHVYNAADNLFRPQRNAYLLGKHAIELDNVDRHILEDIQGGVARAKVIHKDEEPLILQSFHHFEQLLGVF